MSLPLKKNNKKTKVFKYFEKLGFTLASKEHPDGEKLLQILFLGEKIMCGLAGFISNQNF